jgi:NADPH:quinone reductase-like Zn-dependent oxidoreductase
MRAIWITRPGGPEALAVRDTADPDPAPGQVRIRVHAAGLCFADVMAAQGLSLWNQDKIKPRIDGSYPFTQAAAAHRRLLQRQNVGKIVLTP